jgi:predicted NACHT family NTPase
VHTLLGEEDTIPLKEFLATIQNTQTGAFVLLGEAGVGKSVTCRSLTVSLAQAQNLDIIPVYVPLGEWLGTESWAEFLDDTIVHVGWKKLQQTATDTDRRIVVFLDGLNEVPVKKCRDVVAFIRYAVHRRAHDRVEQLAYSRISHETDNKERSGWVRNGEKYEKNGLVMSA